MSDQQALAKNAETIQTLFTQLVRLRGSDLFVQVGAAPAVRVDGYVRRVSETATSPALGQQLLEAILAPHQREQFTRTGECDSAFEIPGVGRFRVNVFSHRGALGFCFRHVKLMLPSLDELHLPVDQLVKLSRLRRGIILITGTAGSGKSTTLAAMINYLNQNEPRHIVTLEDPVEYVFPSRTCTIHQREVGVDTLSFASALRHIVRQSPDVIMVGEMRDRETIEAVLHAAETGHLVMSTLHTVNAPQTVERIMAFFSSDQHALIRTQLSMLLEGVVSQRLLPRADGPGRVPAIELLLSTPTIKEMLAQGRAGELRGAIREGSDHYGTVTFNQSLVSLVRQNLITIEEALANSDNPDEIQLELRGIMKGGRGRAVFDGNGFSVPNASGAAPPPAQDKPRPPSRSERANGA